MSELLKIILSLSLSGTLLFFILLALKPLYKNKLSKRWQYYIWLIVVVRMLLPFTPETTFVGSVFQRLENINVETMQIPPPANDSQANFRLDDSYIMPGAERQVPKPTTDTAPSLSIQAIFSKVYENLWILWAAIAFALLIRKITMYQSFVRFVKAGWVEVSDIEILNMLADTGEMIGVKRPVELFTNPLISSPMLLGFFRPYIIFPSIELKNTELSYIMRHELTHYKHLDMLYKWFVQIAVCLHWFNPFVYLMAKEISKCCELSCDESMIKAMDQEERTAYGDTLLNSLKGMGNYNDKLATVTLTESAKQLKERLEAIMKFKKASKITVTIMLVLTLVLTVGATAIGAYAATPVNNNNNVNTTVIPQPPSNNNSTNISEQLTVASSGILPDNTKELTISFDIDNGGIEILPATSNEIKANYDSEYYNVTLANKNGKWVVNVTGKVAMMGKTDDVRIYIPDIKCTMDVDVLNGNFSYALPDNCEDIINITAANSGIDFTSKNHYKNSAISLIATNKDFIKYEQPVYPSYFTKTNTRLEYTNGTGENQISIKLTGYTSVNFVEISAATPWSAMGGTNQPYTYSQQGYYQGGYIFELGWNLNEKGYEAYLDKSKFTLSDGSTITVSFDESCKNEAQNTIVLADLKELVERLKKQNTNSSAPLEKPLLVSVKYVGNSDLIKLAEEYYTNNELTSFSAIFSSLDAAIQKEYCTKMIESGKTAFLSSCAKSMKSDMIDYCTEKTYQEDKIALFTCIAPYLSDDQKQTWIASASRDKKNTFLSVLTKDE